jgi:hypothetical protein
MMEYSFDVLVVIRMNPAAEDELLFIPLLSIPLCHVFSSPHFHSFKKLSLLSKEQNLFILFLSNPQRK